jgi:hypothetical protein
VIASSSALLSNNSICQNYGSGIGTAYSNSGDSIIWHITISNSILTANSLSSSPASVLAISTNYGSGIGTASSSFGNSTIGVLRIENANITASSSSSSFASQKSIVQNYGSGIGTSQGSSGNSTIGTVFISNSIITSNSSSFSSSSCSTSPNYGSGIGTSQSNFGNSAIDTVFIVNAIITASSSSSSLTSQESVVPNSGSAIGTGNVWSGNSRIGNLTISNAKITASSTDWSAIGSGSADGSGGRSAIDVIAFTDNNVLILQSGCQGRPIEATTIHLLNTSTILVVEERPVFNVSSFVGDNFDLSILSENIASSPNQESNVPAGGSLQIGDLKFPNAEGWTLCLADGTHHRCLRIDLPGTRRVKSLTVFLPWVGTYTITASANQTSGYFIASTNDSLFSVSADFSFIESARFIPFASVSLSVPPSSIPASPVPASTSPSKYRTRSLSPEKAIIVIDEDAAMSGAVGLVYGAGVGGFAAIAALLLLLFLIKKRRAPELIEQDADMQDLSLDTTNEASNSFSEYGLSEGGPPGD